MNDTTSNKVITTDSTGRTITIRKLTALDRMRVFELAGPELSENRQWLVFALSAASVTDINGQPEAFPSSKRKIENMISILGDAGLDAIGEAWGKNFTVGESAELADVRPL
jgi:hypothetical protein